MKESDEPLLDAPVRRRRGGVALVLLMSLLAIFVAMWLVRKPIAGRFIDREFARRGVPARYVIADLGLGRQRLTKVVIGDPRRPDLTADWIETDTGVGLAGPYLSGVRAGHVRLRGRVMDGQVRLGSIDRLLPPPSGKPFALPAIGLDVADGRIVLATPAGAVWLTLAGRGRLDDGWRGTVRAASPVLARGKCAAVGLTGALRVAVDRARPSLAGPLRLTSLRCGAASLRMPSMTIEVGLSAALDRWKGRAALTGGRIAAVGVSAQSVEGGLSFTGSGAETGGAADLTARAVAGALGSAEAVQLSGRYRVGEQSGFEGRAGWRGATVATRWLGVLDRVRRASTTPIGPVASVVTGAARAMTRDASGAVSLTVRGAGAGGEVVVRQLDWRGGSGGRAGFAGGDGIAIRWPGGATRIDGSLALRGGGLPTLDVKLTQAAAGAPIRGTAVMQPYAVAGGRLALAPIRFRAGADGATRIETRATLSGPLGDGRVEGLAIPLTARWAAGTLMVAPDCAAIGWQRLAISGLVLTPATVQVCPLGSALLRVSGGTAVGGTRFGATHLTGRIGSSALSIAWQGGELRLGDRAFMLAGVRTRIGQPGRETRIEADHIDGRADGRSVAGTFSGGGGQIGAVPLLLAKGTGRWRFADGRLTLGGSLAVRDADVATPRFKPMEARDVTLTMLDNAITAAGTLAEPSTGTRVAAVRIAHDLSTSSGRADLAVADLAFGETFQPDLLTPLTYGVVADVKGDVTGAARIAWTAAGVTSTGDVRTGGLDLAAAFGPVTGLATTIHFTDLLSLTSAPHQTATIAAINPGIAVTDGTVSYRLLPDTRIQVERGSWPFAGGALTLEPTLLDFGEARERRLTFRIAGMAADQFLQQFDFKNIDATGTFDGVLPMTFDTAGGRIDNGSLTVREGGGTIAYVGDLSQKDLGFWGNFAFQTLRSLRYRSLGITMNGPLAGEMVTQVRFAGIRQGEGAQRNFLIRRLQRLPIVFNVTIRAPFRGLLDTAQSFYDPKRLIQRNLPQLIEQQNRQAQPPGQPVPVQPPASETAP